MIDITTTQMSYLYRSDRDEYCTFTASKDIKYLDILIGISINIVLIFYSYNI
jgi:hypothetical protein